MAGKNNRQNDSQISKIIAKDWQARLLSEFNTVPPCPASIACDALATS